MTEVLDIDQACEFLKLAKVTMYKYVRSGEVPAFKMGRVWKFHKSTLEKWVEGKVQSDTKARNNARATRKGAS